MWIIDWLSQTGNSKLDTKEWVDWWGLSDLKWDIMNESFVFLLELVQSFISPTPRGLQIAASKKQMVGRLSKEAEEWQFEEATLVLILYTTGERERERERERVQWPTLIWFAELSCWVQPSSVMKIQDHLRKKDWEARHQEGQDAISLVLANNLQRTKW